MKGISISEVLMYVIAVVIIVGLTFYFAFFLNVSASASMSSETYLLFLNSLYLNRINYCTYLATNDPNYLFYFVRDMDISNIEGLSDYIKYCFSRVVENVSIPEGNYSVDSDEDLNKLSEKVCGGSGRLKSSIRDECKNCIIVVLRINEMSTVPVFAYIKIGSDDINWIIEPAKALFEQEKTDKDWNQEFLKNVIKFIFPPAYFAWWLYEKYQEYQELKLIEALEKNANSFVDCMASGSKSYSIVPTFALQELVVDMNRDLYVLAVMQFSKTKYLGRSIVIYNLTSRNVTPMSEDEFKGRYCRQQSERRWDIKR